jgi:chromate transporter
MLHTEFCVRRKVLPDEEFQLLFGLSRVVPGMNLLSLTVLLGHRRHGLPGALLSLVSLTVPSFCLILLGCRLLRGNPANSALAGAVRGLGPAAAALFAYTSWDLCRKSLEGQRTFSRLSWLGLLFITTAVALRGVLHPAWLVIGGGVAGVLLARSGVTEGSEG